MTDGPSKVKFLLSMAQRFMADGNYGEAIKSEETALLLRKSLGPAGEKDDGQVFTSSLDKQAQELVMKCNAHGVQAFQQDDFDRAIFLLNKGLFLTEAAPETNCFRGHEHDRLRLRAATYNNLGCLEKRRNQMQNALMYLHKAVELEAIVDPDFGASPSTNMNLCTVLNKLGKHVQAASAAERAVTGLKFQGQQGQEHLPQFAAMLVMAYYNHGVSLEFAARPGDIALAQECYANAINTGKRLLDDPGNNASYIAAEKAFRRLTAATGASLLPQIAPNSNNLAGRNSRLLSSPGSEAGTVAGSIRAPVTTRPFGDSPMSSNYSPRPPDASTRTEGPPQRGFGSHFGNMGNDSKRAASSGGRLDTASHKHAERIQSRQRRKEQMKERSEVALKRAQQAHVREKHEKMRRERELEAQRRDEMAKAMYEKMVNGLRAEEIRKVKQAARKIQKVWRGYLVRNYIALMERSVVKMQACVRSYLCRRRLRIEREIALQRALDEAERQRRTKAAVVIQRRARMFFYRLHLIRTYRANQLRRLMSTKRIQRFYRSYRLRMEQRILERIEEERRMDEERTELLNTAACKIQGMYRAFKSRRFARVVRLETTRRNIAATKIQAQVRGALTRQWFKHYRTYRRQQELSTASNLRRIIRIQRTWRMAVAKKTRRRLELEKHHKERQKLLFLSTRRIQCAYRSFVARRELSIRMERLRRRQNAAEKIQSLWAAYQCRKIYLWRRDEHRKKKAIRHIQEWWRLLQLKWKHQEVARYHNAKRKEELIATIRTAAAISIQQAGRALLSSRIMGELHAKWLEHSSVAAVVQRVGRHFLVQKEMALLKNVAYLVDRQQKQKALFTKASTSIQRATRMFLAKLKVERIRRRRTAAVVIQKTARMHFAKQERRRRERVKQDGIEHAAACKIQKSMRLFLKRQQLRQLDEYYTERRRQKLALMRREEAAITIQALWRGYVTRQWTASERSKLLQNTIEAIRIQRAWRTHLFRLGIGMEIQRRIAKKRLRLRSATRIQCFWRRILAQEYVSYLREKRFHQTVAIIQIQCCYRRFRARNELALRRVARQQQQLMEARRHDQCTVASDIANSCLRTILAGRLRLELLEEDCNARIERRDRASYRRRYNAATKVQALYRGHYERVYARGLRKERMEKERAERELAEKQRKAAETMQRGWRCAKARSVVNQLRAEKRLETETELLKAEREANPKDLIKQLFWSHEAMIHKNLTKERYERNARTTWAATQIQRIVRGFVQVRRFTRLREEGRRNVAAAAIQEKWLIHEKKLSKEREAARKRAATKIQSVIRMFLVRATWSNKRQVLQRAQQASTTEEERQDQAATRIQASWRRVMACRRADKIRLQLFHEKEAQIEFEAARMIQKHFRGHVGRERVKEIRANIAVPSRPSQAPPAVRRPYPNANAGPSAKKH